MGRRARRDRIDRAALQRFGLVKRTGGQQDGVAGANDALAAEIVPNLSVMFARLLEQSGRAAGNILDGHVAHGAA